MPQVELRLGIALFGRFMEPGGRRRRIFLDATSAGVEQA